MTTAELGDTIGTLTVTASRRRARLVERQLASADLRMPGLPDRSVLVVRRLRIQLDAEPDGDDVERRPGTASPATPGAAATAVAREPTGVGGAVSEALDGLVATAARPRAGRIEGGPTAILFADDAELVACLLVDLVDGSPARWWWRHLRLDRRPTVARQLADRAPLVPAVFHHLARWGQADRIVDSMAEPQLVAVDRAVRAAHRVAGNGGSSPGRSPRSGDDDRPAGTSRRRSAEPRAADHGGQPTGAGALRATIDLLVARTGHRPIFGSGRASPARRRPERERVDDPGPTTRPPSAAAGAPSAELDRRPRPTRPSSDPTEPGQGPGSAGASDRIGGSRSPGPGPQPSGDDAAAPAGATASDGEPPTAVETAGGDEAAGWRPTGQLTTVDRSAAPAHRPGLRPVRSGVDRTAGPIGAERPAADRVTAEPAAIPDALVAPTAYGGIFYLLNPIRRLGLTAGDRPGGVWALLRALAHRLAPEVADDPVDALLARLGAEGPVEPDRAVDGEVDAVLAHLTAGPGLDPSALAALIEVPATVRLTETHLDVELPLAAVDIEARRHGLDTDPGWYPESGLVIRFHFGT